MERDRNARLSVAGEHFRQNRLLEAERELRAILDQEPDLLPALTLMAGIRFRGGVIEEAARLLEGVLEKDPRQVDAIGLLAIIRKSQGDFPRAAELFQRLVNLNKGTADIFNQLGACKMALQDWIGAGAAFKRAVELDRSKPENYSNLGVALLKTGANFESFATFKRAIQLNPNHFDGYPQLWESMRRLSMWEEGLPILEDGLRRNPASGEMMVMVAITYGKAGRKEQAEELFTKAADVDGGSILPYAHWLQEEGRFEESVPLLVKEVEARPMQGQAYYAMAMARRFESQGDSFSNLLPSILEQGDLEGEERMFLHYALAKSLERDKTFEQAMQQYDLANKLARDLYIENGEEEESPGFEALEKVYSPASIDRLAPMGSDSDIPIFIVGMIRTGTTLFDQILSSHRSISSAGEQPFWQVSAGRYNNRWLKREPTSKDMRELEQGYLQALRPYLGRSKRVTDKMPTNFWHVGMISLTFPRAKIIHTRRNPMDTVLSIYTTFLGKGTQFAYDQDNIVNYYRAYMKAMELWRSVLPAGRMLEIDYEELVSEKEAVLRRVIDFLGLDWDPACLEHEKHASHVSTPSLFTARQPVNAASVDRWRRYEPWLGKLLELKDVTHP